MRTWGPAKSGNSIHVGEDSRAIQSFPVVRPSANSFLSCTHLFSLFVSAFPGPTATHLYGCAQTLLGRRTTTRCNLVSSSAVCFLWPPYSPQPSSDSPIVRPAAHRSVPFACLFLIFGPSISQLGPAPRQPPPKLPYAGESERESQGGVSGLLHLGRLWVPSSEGRAGLLLSGAFCSHFSAVFPKTSG